MRKHFSKKSIRSHHFIETALIQNADRSTRNLDGAVFVHFFQAAADGLSCTSNGTGNSFLGEVELIRTGIGSFIQKKGSNALRKREKESPLDPGDHIREMFGCQFVDEVFQIDIVLYQSRKRHSREEQ